MNEEIKKLKTEIDKLKEEMRLLTQKVSQATALQFDASDKMIINKKVQFLQPVYNASGTKLHN